MSEIATATPVAAAHKYENIYQIICKSASFSCQVMRSWHEKYFSHVKHRFLVSVHLVHSSGIPSAISATSDIALGIEIRTNTRVQALLLLINHIVLMML